MVSNNWGQSNCMLSLTSHDKGSTLSGQFGAKVTREHDSQLKFRQSPRPLETRFWPKQSRSACKAWAEARVACCSSTAGTPEAVPGSVLKHFDKGGAQSVYTKRKLFQCVGISSKHATMAWRSHGPPIKSAQRGQRHGGGSRPVYNVSRGRPAFQT